jgi:hypothetical protein
MIAWVLLMSVSVAIIVVLITTTISKDNKYTDSKDKDKDTDSEDVDDIMFITDIKFEKFPTTFKHVHNDMPILIYMHIAMIHEWTYIIKRIMFQIEKSGFQGIVNMGCVGDENLMSEIDALKNTWSNIIVNTRYLGDVSQYERPTLYWLHDDATKASQNGDKFIAFYLHSKGVTHPRDVFINAWVGYMLHFCTQWDINRELLNIYDTVGVNLIIHSLHYSGNFWLSSSEHISNLKTPITGGYIDPELWVGSVRAKQHFSLSHARGNLYKQLPDNTNYDFTIYSKLIPEEPNMSKSIEEKPIHLYIHMDEECEDILNRLGDFQGVVNVTSAVEPSEQLKINWRQRKTIDDSNSTLEWIYEDCTNNNINVVYIQCSKKTLQDPKFHYCIQWRVNNELCKLYDTIDIDTFYDGNYWWSSSNYIKKLTPKPENSTLWRNEKKGRHMRLTDPIRNHEEYNFTELIMVN